MIICHSRQFIFLHGRKTAGSSIGTSLNRFLADGDASMGYVGACRDAGITPPDWQRRWQHLRPWDLRRRKPGYAAYKRMTRNVHGITSTHMPASAVRTLVGDEIWDSYFKVSFERHPVDRTISFFHWRTRNTSHQPTLEAFVKAIENQDLKFLKAHHLADFSNKQIYTLEGEICVDFLGHFENLAEDMTALSSKLGLEWDGWLPNEKRGIRPRPETHQGRVDDKLRLRLAKSLRQEMLLLGYENQAQNSHQ